MSTRTLAEATLIKFAWEDRVAARKAATVTAREFLYGRCSGYRSALRTIRVMGDMKGVDEHEG
jgi:hypothetical protein